MSTQYIQLKNPSGDLLYPRTDWSVILNRPSFATIAQLNTKQDQLTSLNAGNGITIESQEGILRISATAVGNYVNLSNKPRINGIELNGSLTAADLNIAQLESTDTGDWEVADEVGNVILRLVGGHILTKYFDSQDVITSDWLIANSYLNTSNLSAALDAEDVLRSMGASSSAFVILNEAGQPIITVNRTTGAFQVLGTPGFDSATLLTRISNLESNAITTSTLGSALTSGHYNISLFANDSAYVTSSALATALATKQDTLTTANAGTNVTITTVGGVLKINATGGGGGGTTDYNALSNRPQINGVTLVGNQTATTLGLPSIGPDGSSTDGILEFADETQNVIARFSDGHIRTKNFDSSEVYPYINNLIANSGFATTSYVTTAISNAHPNYWGDKPYPSISTGTPQYILGQLNGSTTPYWLPYTLFSNPMSAANDVIIGGVSGVPTRLGVGANGTFLKAGAPISWAQLTGSDIYGGTSGYFLCSNGSGNAASWAAVADTWRPIEVNGTAWKSSATSSLKINFRAGNGMTITQDDPSTGDLTFAVSGQPQPCLIKGTKIAMADGSDKNIEDIKTGDEILSWDVNSKALTKAIVVSNHRNGAALEFMSHLFDDGSYIVTYGVHMVYNKTKGYPIDIAEFEVGDTTINSKGETITYVGKLRYRVRKKNSVSYYALTTSNNLYFAGGVLNGMTVFAKYRAAEYDGLEIPDELNEICKEEEKIISDAAGFGTDEHYLQEISAAFKQKNELTKRIAQAKQRLNDTDYIVQKFTEGLISTTDWSYSKLERESYRQIINDSEPLLQEANDMIKGIQGKYHTSFKGKKARFKSYCALDNAAFDIYKQWLHKGD